MSEASKAPGRNEHSLASWLRREQILQTFEAAWQRGEQPRLDDYLPAEDADRLARRRESSTERSVGEGPAGAVRIHDACCCGCTIGSRRTMWTRETTS